VLACRPHRLRHDELVMLILTGGTVDCSPYGLNASAPAFHQKCRRSSESPRDAVSRVSRRQRTASRSRSLSSWLHRSCRHPLVESYEWARSSRDPLYRTGYLVDARVCHTFQSGVYRTLVRTSPTGLESDARGMVLWSNSRRYCANAGLLVTTEGRPHTAPVRKTECPLNSPSSGLLSMAVPAQDSCAQTWTVPNRHGYRYYDRNSAIWPPAESLR
jgi:hypothetical protein